MLPESYRKLIYIENARPGSYIDTGLLATYDMKIVIDGCVIEGDTALVGARTAINCSDIFTLQFTSERNYRFSFNTSRVTAPKTYVAGARHVFRISRDGLYIDDVLIGEPALRSVEGVLPLFFMGSINTGGVASSFGIVRVYSAQFYRGEELIADYLPCMTKEGIYGFYDNVNGILKENSGEGSFTGMLEPFIGIEITKLPDKLIYKKGERITTSGMVVEEYTESGYREEVKDYVISGYDPSITGTQAITVSYDGMYTTFAVIVNDVPSGDKIVTLDEMKKYLRVDFEEDDDLIDRMISSAEELCMDVARTKDKDEFAGYENSKLAVMYTVAYMYEHREEADHHDLTITLRSLLFGIREEVF